MRAGILLAALVIGGAWAGAQEGDSLESGFLNPPDSAKPRVWWHWMNGNVSKDGIQADLEWMKRVGIGGFQNFDASLNTPRVVEKRLVYMTPEWKDAFRFTVELADRLGLEMAIAGSPGWSESGGPWVKPEQGMKKFVWSETRVAGGRPFTGVLEKPPTISGPFQNLASSEEPVPPDYYQDAAVVAFPTPDGDLTMTELAPKVTSSAGEIDAGAVADGNLTNGVPLAAAPEGKQAWIQYDFGKAQGISAITLRASYMGRRRNSPELLASDDGVAFQSVVRIPGGGAPEHTVSFPEVRARYFRVTFTTPQMPPAAANSKAVSEHRVGKLVLYAIPRVNRFEDKAAFEPTEGLYAMATPQVPGAEAIAQRSVIDLTSKMRADGRLDWTPPAGKWTVLRFGYSLLGINNHPASPEATGLEVDKLSASAVKAYFENYLDQYKDATGGLMGQRGLRFMITDSWEAGAENWTDDMFAQFAKRRGYDLRPWIPALTGHVVGSAEASDRVLWDFRKTIAELTAENHYDQLTALLHERGMGRYSESHETDRALIADGMAVKRTADIPMSAMWTGGHGPHGIPADYAADVRESASVAHIYGQNLVAAESLTAGNGAFTYSPETLKPTADGELSQGLNRFVIHTSVHQPLSDKRPGLSLGPFGQWFTRLETWGELAKPWTTYLARSSYMLQQGRFVADILYYYGEDSNITALFGDKPPDIPDGYNFDYANSDVVLNRISVVDGRLNTASGMSYAVLALDPNARHMPLNVLRRIRELVNAGAVIAGPKPIDSPSLSDDQAEVERIADELWGSSTGAHSFGKGKVYGGMRIADAAAGEKIDPDFTYSKPEPDADILFVHRKIQDGEIYWVNSRRNRAEKVEATFRVTGKAAELWHADTGKIEPAAYRVESGRTTVSLNMDANDALFVVFRKTAAAPSRTVTEMMETVLSSVEGAWEVSFPPDRGAPAKITLEALSSWSENADAGVKYFSGTGTYSKQIDVPALPGGSQIWLDLGDVKNLAEVSVNGKALGILWKAPFRVNVTGVLKPGANAVEIKVTNLWVNRIIGDQQPDVKQKYTFTVWKFYRADSTLLPSGLLGPVKVVAIGARQ